MQDAEYSNSDQVLDQCESILGYKFKDRSTLKSALIHASRASDRLASNERLEFLGDAVMGFVVCEQLYRQFPEHLEGELTKIKSVVVSGSICAQISYSLGLDKQLFLGKGMAKRERVPTSLAAAVFESVVAAVYIDGGISAARELVLTHMQAIIDQAADSENQHNYKSQLQQHVQRELNTSIAYELLDEQGPDHSKCFEICVRIGSRRFATAWGPSKKEAEQGAAYNALAELELLKSQDTSATVNP